jgi:hypothetical protein
MAEQKKPGTDQSKASSASGTPDTRETKSAQPPKAESATPKRALSPASESSDPTVHQILADIETARRNGDDEAVETHTRRLNDLGYE